MDRIQIAKKRLKRISYLLGGIGIMKLNLPCSLIISSRSYNLSRTLRRTPNITIQTFQNVNNQLEVAPDTDKGIDLW